MGLNCSVNTDILGILSLLFTIAMALRNEVMNKNGTNIYVAASAVTIALMCLEIITITFDSSANTSDVLAYRIANVAGFSLSPVVPCILIFLNNKELYHKAKIFFIPLLMNFLVCALSYWTGWIFYVSADNVYMRGELFFIPTAVSIIYYVLLIESIRKSDIKYDNFDKIYMSAIFAVPIFATTIQIMFKQVIILWGSVAQTLVFLYIFLRDMQFKYDVISGIKNRNEFEKKIELYNKKHSDVAIVMLDLNDFKSINDSFGHISGDDAIASAAKLLSYSFEELGETYRYGGDEFCVICEKPCRKNIDQALLKLDSMADEESKKHDYRLSFAYGYDFYVHSVDYEIQDAVKRADKRMYEHKIKLKENC